MPKKKERLIGEKIYACDFETYVSEDTNTQKETHVWSSACVELLEGKAVKIRESFPAMLKAIANEQPEGETITLYFHNLKFDGVFILDYLLKEGREFVKYNRQGYNGKEYFDRGILNNNQYSCVISDLGAFYTIDFKAYGLIFHVVDSYKLIPLSLKKAGEGFNTAHKKTEMSYTGNKTIYTLSEKDRAYIMNDVIVLKEILLYMFNEGHQSLTIGSCCMTEFRKDYDNQRWSELFPDLTQLKCGESGLSQFEYCAKAYRGGWCYVNDKISEKILYNGENYDANSHYPSMMIDVLSMYPIGIGAYYKAYNNRLGEVCERRMKNKNWYYFIRIKCAFKLKENFFPFIQIKGSPFFNGREMLKDSTPTRFKKYKSIKIGTEKFDSRVELCLTCKDFELFKKSYYIDNLEVIDCLMFQALEGEELFGKYIRKYMRMKVEAGKTKNKALKQIAKLFLNNLYGKFGTKPDSSYKVPKLDKDERITYDLIEAHDKKPGYMAIGAAITSYARCKTVTLADENYNHFAYSDTDSIHLYNCPPDFTFKGVKIDPDEFGAWANEASWDQATFLRAKTYAEHITKEDGKEVQAYWTVKAAGMTQMGKEEASKIIIHNGLDSYRIGLSVPSLKPVNIAGGVLLRETSFSIK